MKGIERARQRQTERERDIEREGERETISARRVFIASKSKRKIRDVVLESEPQRLRLCVGVYSHRGSLFAVLFFRLHATACTRVVFA